MTIYGQKDVTAMTSDEVDRSSQGYFVPDPWFCKDWPRIMGVVVSMPGGESLQISEAALDFIEELQQNRYRVKLCPTSGYFIVPLYPGEYEVRAVTNHEYEFWPFKIFVPYLWKCEIPINMCVCSIKEAERNTMIGPVLDRGLSTLGLVSSVQKVSVPKLDYKAIREKVIRGEYD